MDPRRPVTRAQFLKWRYPRSGRSNPERVRNPVWEWIIREQPEWSAYEIRKHFGMEAEMPSRAGWCFQRHGRSITMLPDGRVVRIAGEHEDYYDPDFFIYNDVVVTRPDGGTDIFTYPTSVFPPTDFHSATLREGQIILVGNLGYQGGRQPGFTPVFAVDTDSFAIASVETSGVSPGWIHSHSAVSSPDGRTIRIEGGQVDRGESSRSLVENIDAWTLDLEARIWTRMTDRNWVRREVRREDGERNHFWEMDWAAWTHRFPEFKTMDNAHGPTLEEELGGPPDLELFARRYRPPLPHDAMPAREGESNAHRIRVGGVVVRYVEDVMQVQMTVEGELPAAVVDCLALHLAETMASLERSPCEVVRL